jgi:hypothetical protein
MVTLRLPPDTPADLQERLYDELARLQAALELQLS